MNNQCSLMDDPFQIVSVRPAKAPLAAQGLNWHCYVIAQGTNTIRGYRQGSLGLVTEAVEEIVTQLNERRAGKRGRVHLVLPARKKPDIVP